MKHLLTTMAMVFLLIGCNTTSASDQITDTPEPKEESTPNVKIPAGQLYPMPKVLACGDSDGIYKAIEGVGERPVALWTAADRTSELILFVHPENYTVTLLEYSPDGKLACLNSIGIDAHLVPWKQGEKTSTKIKIRLDKN